MSASSRKPRIGVTLDSEDAGGYSRLPWYALRQNYCSAVVAAGGVPVPLPHEPALVEDYLEALDGLIVTGGHFDLDPSLYGAPERHASVTTKDRRTAFEMAITRGALARRLPILGICGGQQLLAVALGGTLIQHIPDTVRDALAHEQPNPRTEPGHEVSVVAGTRLHAITGCDSFPVNSAHHQAVAEAGPGVVVSARAGDGVIEAIELADHPFCLGVQWHPEYGISAADSAIFSAFLDACRTRRRVAA